MRAWFTNLTAVLLFIHAVLGCCWHHAHECDRCGAERCGAEEASGFAHAALGLCGCHDCADDDHGQPAGPCRCQFECQGVCTYLPPEKSSLDAGLSGADFDGADFDFWAVTATPRAANIGEATAHAHSFIPPRAATPLPPHLLHQVLLI